MLTRTVKSSIANIESFISSNQTYYRKMYNIHNTLKLNKFISIRNIHHMSNNMSNINDINDINNNFINGQINLKNLTNYNNNNKGVDFINRAQHVNLQKNEIETRILKILYDGNFVDIREFQFQHDLRKDWNLDQLSITALISSIEQQFSTIFDIHVYEDVRTLIDVIQLLEQDQTIV